MVGGSTTTEEYDNGRRQIIMRQQHHHDQEHHQREEDGAAGHGGSSSSSSSRWKPTKEQIRVLEGMYSGGLRTPTAQQIQHITRILTNHGAAHIQPKNVFYWFQNHKARQRHKLKHHYPNNPQHININFPSSSYLNDYPPSPPFPFFPPPHYPPQYPTCSNPPPVVCSPCHHIPNEHLGFYNQFPKVQVQPPPPPPESLNEMQQPPTQLWYNQATQGYPRRSQYQQQTFHFMNSPTDEIMRASHPQQTLDLFPMHPTGILQTRNNYIEIHEQLEEGDEDGKCPDDDAVPNTQTWF